MKDRVFEPLLRYPSRVLPRRRSKRTKETNRHDLFETGKESRADDENLGNQQWVRPTCPPPPCSKSIKHFERRYGQWYSGMRNG